ncbi:helicase HerA domain-containing protein [Coleofasciculus sp. E1-EBD-02]|uniref:helicase HerA domain-containing protein n=1 Tax=Coleofasciculus sp. E1-EBD-02 TaxID=3068481 RepID=UPI0032F513B9
MAFSKHQERANTILVGVISGLGLLTLATSFHGRQTDLIEYCFKPNASPHFCTPDKRYVMPVSEWQALKSEPASNPKSQIPQKATRLRIIEATNPHKWAWGLISAGLFGSAYLLSKARERKLLELLPQYRNEVKQSWLLNKIQSINTARKVEYAANLDYQLWQFSADRAARAKQLSMLSPEEIAIFQEQARLQAQAEAQAQLNHTTGTPTAALPHGTPGTMDEQARQGKFESGHAWVNNFVKQTALVWGNQGSGKSWFARYLAQRKVEQGYKVIVLDPDSNPSEWRGVESHHDWEDITSFLRWYVDELTHRYSQFNGSTMTEEEWREQLWRNGDAIAVICEEVTTWANIIDDQELLTKFFRLALTKSRKQEMPCTFVSHNNTQSALGNIKGLANLIGRMLQLQLETQVNPETLQPTASGKGLVKLDGNDEWIPVTLPIIDSKITQFHAPNPTQIEILHDEPQETVELKLSDELGEPLKTIWLFAKERGDWIKPRDIQRKDYAVLKGKGSEDIRRYLGLLNDLGYGELDESDGSVRFKAF